MLYVSWVAPGVLELDLYHTPGERGNEALRHNNIPAYIAGLHIPSSLDCWHVRRLPTLEVSAKSATDANLKARVTRKILEMEAEQPPSA